MINNIMIKTKKIINLFFIGIITAIITSLFWISLILLGREIITSASAKDNEMKNYIINNEIQNQDEYMYKTKEAFSLLPEEIKNTFIDDNWSIEFQDEIDAGKYSGKCYYMKKKILLARNNSAIEKTVLHEFGHYIDYKLFFKSNSDEWKLIYNIEKSKVREYAQSSPQEFFAEIFEKTMVNPEETKLNTPKAYKYMLECINDIEKLQG